MSAAKEQGETPGKRVRTAQRPAASVNMEELRELIALLRENGLAELELENEGFRVRLRRESTAGMSVANAPRHAPAPAPAPAAPAPPLPLQHIPARRRPQRLLRIRIYTSLRRPSSARSIVRLRRLPNPFVKIGSNVEQESVVCIIEAMKLMNEIQAEATW